MKVLVLMTIIALAGAQNPDGPPTVTCEFRKSLQTLGFKITQGRLLDSFNDTDPYLQERCEERCCQTLECASIAFSAALGLGDAAVNECELWAEVSGRSGPDEFPEWTIIDQGVDVTAPPENAATASAEASLVTLVLPMAVAVVMYLNSVLVQQ